MAELQGFLLADSAGLWEMAAACPSPASGAAAESAACPESTDPGFGGRCLAGGGKK